MLIASTVPFPDYATTPLWSDADFRGNVETFIIPAAVGSRSCNTTRDVYFSVISFSGMGQFKVIVSPTISMVVNAAIEGDESDANVPAGHWYWSRVEDILGNASDRWTVALDGQRYMRRTAVRDGLFWYLSSDIQFWRGWVIPYCPGAPACADFRVMINGDYWKNEPLEDVAATVVHEMGHMYFEIRDEYGGWPQPDCENAPVVGTHGGRCGHSIMVGGRRSNWWHIRDFCSNVDHALDGETRCPSLEGTTSNWEEIHSVTFGTNIQFCDNKKDSGADLSDFNYQLTGRTDTRTGDRIHDIELFEND